MRRSSRRLSIGIGAAVAASIVADALWSDPSPLRIVLYALAAGASTLLIAAMLFYLHARRALPTAAGPGAPNGTRGWFDRALLYVLLVVIDGALWAIDPSPYRGWVAAAATASALLSFLLSPRELTAAGD